MGGESSKNKDPYAQEGKLRFNNEAAFLFVRNIFWLPPGIKLFNRPLKMGTHGRRKIMGDYNGQIPHSGESGIHCFRNYFAKTILRSLVPGGRDERGRSNAHKIQRNTKTTWNDAERHQQVRANVAGLSL